MYAWRWNELSSFLVCDHFQTIEEEKSTDGERSGWSSHDPLKWMLLVRRGTLGLQTPDSTPSREDAVD